MNTMMHKVLPPVLNTARKTAALSVMSAAFVTLSAFTGRALPNCGRFSGESALAQQVPGFGHGAPT